jgi:hypothetical protein
VQAVAGATGYQARSNSDRCEGLYVSPVAGETLELFSFVAGMIRYDLSSDTVLTVVVPDVAHLQSTVVNVRARAFESDVFYRMDATVEGGKSMDWPLNAVIAPLGLQADDIGILAWIDRGDDTIYVPVSVVSKNTSRESANATVAAFRSSEELEVVRWRVWSASTRTSDWRTIRSSSDHPVEAYEPVQFVVQRSPFVQTLEVDARPTNSNDWLVERVRVYAP